MENLREHELQAIKHWLSMVYLAGPAKEIARALDQINGLMERIQQVLDAIKQSSNEPDQ